jgi:hypothetical protein
MVEQVNGNGFSVWRRGLSERLRGPKGPTAARIGTVEGLLAELRQRRAGLEATIADATAKEEACAVEGRDFSDVAKVRAGALRARWDHTQAVAAEKALFEELALLRSRQRQENLEAFQGEQREALQAGLAKLAEALDHFDAARAVWERASGSGFQLLGTPQVWTRQTAASLRAELAGEPFPRLQPQPVVRVPATERRPLPHEPVGHGASTYTPAPPVRPPVRALRHDGPPQGGEAQVVLLRAGIEFGDGFTGLAGDVVNVPAAQAIELVRHSAAEYTAVAGG